MKICTKCKIEKEILEFCKDKTTKDGRHPWCRNCRTNKRMEWFNKNKEKHYKSYNEWYLRNNEEQKIRIRKWYKENKDWMMKYLKKWRQENPDKIRSYRVARDERIKGDFTSAQWREIKKQYNYTCLACGKKESEIVLSADHIIPIIEGGKHTKSNIQPLCVSCNSIKWRKIIDYRERQYAATI